MAYYGLSQPWIVPWTADNTYTAASAFKCGKLVGTSVTPNHSNASLYADDALGEYADEFVDADVTLNTDRLPVEAASVMFGHTVSGSSGSETVTHSSDDVSPYVGYGFIVRKSEDNVTKYQACVLCKVKFSDGAESFATKGNQITFATPSITGKALAQADKKWKVVSPSFTDSADAVAWIKTQFGIS